jgi:mTERF domain-containing protein
VDAGKVITRFPQITRYSVDAKFKPMMDYFVDIGVIDFGILIFWSPQTLGLSLELNIKPTITFFTEFGFSTEEITTIVSQFPQLLGLNVEKNIHPKWDYFLRLDRLRSELVDFPQYFGYSLEKRIKPRCEILLSSGLLWTLNRTLSTTETAFRKMLEKDSKHVALISEKIPKF